MIGNVQILKNNGESLVSNGLAHFKFNDTNKQYVIYTLGEQINELLKIYIGYENAPVTDPGILDTESANITELLKKIGKNEDVSAIITILPLSAGLYHIHDKVKKVALHTSAFNNIISTQQRGQIQTLDKDEPIMKENTFFDSSVMKEDKVQEEQSQEQSIFANPMQPVMETTDQQAVPIEEEIKEAPQEEPEETVENQIIETKVEETAKNTNESSGLETDELISDETAKNAILAVESAQATIRENIVIIKEYIKQQRNKVVPKTIETSIDMDDTSKEEISEVPAMSSQVESLPDQYDVVNNLELAPQPEVSENVLSSESDLGGDYSIDTSVNQISSGVDTQNAVDSSIAIPKVDLAQQVPTEVPAELVQPVPTEPQMEISQQADIEPMTQTPLNEQQLPAETTLPNEPQPKIIDTMAMMPQQGEINTNADTLVTGEIQKTDVLDTTNMSIISDSNNIPQSEGNNINNPVPQPMDAVSTGESQSTGLVNEPVSQNDLTSQEAPNSTIDIQIPDVALESSVPESGAVQGVQENIPDIPSIPSIPADSTDMLNNTQQQVKSDTVGGGEFAIPQIDMNVSTVEQPQAPVVMPDGQSQEVNQGLVLTPDAFSKAA